VKKRGFLAASIALLFAPAVRAQSDFDAAFKAATGGAAPKAGRVKLVIPRLADNGHSVPVDVTVESAMTPAEHVRSITLLSSRNPRPLLARFHLGPHSGRAEVTTRLRLNGTQEVTAIAQLSDGSYWSATAQVEVTESACLDMS
jgi:sulfur-oxidizing protein SoxY